MENGDSGLGTADGMHIGDGYELPIRPAAIGVHTAESQEPRAKSRGHTAHNTQKARGNSLQLQLQQSTALAAIISVHNQLRPIS